MSPRRVMVLIKQLPATSRLHCRVIGDESVQRWGSIEHLLASLVDEVRAGRIEARIIGGDRRPPTWKPHPRPTTLHEQREQEVANARARRMLPGLSDPKPPPQPDPRALAALPGSRPGGG